MPKPIVYPACAHGIVAEVARETRMDQRQAAVAEYLSLAHREPDPNATDHIGPLLSYVLNLDEFHNASVVRLFERFHEGPRFAPPADVASAIRAYDGSDHAAFINRLWRMKRWA